MKVISCFLEVTATVNGAAETRVLSFGPMYQPNVPPIPSRNPFDGLELIFGRTSAMNFLGGFGAFSFFRNQSPTAPCWHSFSFFFTAVSVTAVPFETAASLVCPVTAGLMAAARKTRTEEKIVEMFIDLNSKFKVQMSKFKISD